jgi:hypothetical protein
MPAAIDIVGRLLTIHVADLHPINCDPAGGIAATHAGDKPLNLVTRDFECFVTRVHMVLPNDQHQRWEPAAADIRIATDLTGWLPSAECCGSAFLFP